MTSAGQICGIGCAVLATAASAYAAASILIGRRALTLSSQALSSQALPSQALPSRTRPSRVPPPPPGKRGGRVAILKPLHGADAMLRQDLESFFLEARAEGAEIRMGLSGRDDPARAVAEALQAAYPDVQSRLVVSDESWGHNRKISNVINLSAGVEADVLVLADSDIGVRSGYLEAVLAALEDGAGVVTCAYYGRGARGFWSQLAAMGLSYQFLPGVVAGVGLGLARPCMGSTIALRRETLSAVGGFRAFADVLADDYAIGAAVRALGLPSRLAPVLVAHSCTEATPGELFAHELRWARTVRGLDPAGHAGSILTHPVPLALAALGFLGPGPVSLSVLAAALGLRFLAKATVDRATGTRTGGFWLLPLRDIVSFLVFAGSFFGRAVEWRGTKFHVTRGGDLRPV